MEAVDELFSHIEKGMRGHNIGVSTGIPKLDNIIFGTQQSYLYTIGADTGSGKSSLALDVFIYNLVKNGEEIPISIAAYSFEMSASMVLAKLASLYIWDNFNEIISYKDILSLTDILSKEKKEFIDKSRIWLNKVSKMLTIYDRALTPGGIHVTCKDWLKHFGYFEQIDEHTENYVPKDPKRYKIVLIDHIGLIAGPGSKKEKIDKVADDMIYFRNKCQITGIFVQQLNRNAKAVDRKTNGYELVQLDDFKDSSGALDASEVVLALFYPFREKIAKCEGYPIQNVLKGRFRLLQVLKNRWGESDKNIGLNFFGEIGLFKELPRPEEIGDYSLYLELKPEKIIVPQQMNNSVDEINSENIFKF